MNRLPPRSADWRPEWRQVTSPLEVGKPVGSANWLQVPIGDLGRAELARSDHSLTEVLLIQNLHRVPKSTRICNKPADDAHGERQQLKLKLGCNTRGVTKSSSSVKPFPPLKKLTYDLTPEELQKVTKAEVKAHFQKKPAPEKIPVNPAIRAFFLETMKVKQTGQSIEPPTASQRLDYKLISRKKSVESLSKKAVMEKTGTYQRWVFKNGKPMVNPDEERNLTTQLRRLHQWYLKYVKDTDALAFPVVFKNDLLYYEGDGSDYDTSSFWAFNELKYSVTRTVIAMINEEREGKLIDHELLKHVLAIYVEIGSGKLGIYQVEFEQAFLDDTRNYYSRKVETLNLKYSDDPDYMLKAEECLQKERERVVNYLHSSTEPKLVEAVESELITRHAEAQTEA
ncbi:Cullin-1 [Dichanthelium oligosanthes]|uniref:Cullin-1 n=1 Tax=Dichanthelium oligosanthes TaxID=888268 RepID=A0A1E5VI29_9POAL|nr:Cullin-1 [Dichanthelium oligosanthes]